MLTDDEVRDLFSAYHDRELSPERSEAVRAGFARRDGTLVARDEAVLGAKVFALSMATAGLSAWFARALEPAEHHGRHLLLSPGVSWSTPTLVALLGGALALGAFGVARMLRARGDTGAVLREAIERGLGYKLPEQ